MVACEFDDTGDFLFQLRSEAYLGGGILIQNFMGEYLEYCLRIPVKGINGQFILYKGENEQGACDSQG